MKECIYLFVLGQLTTSVEFSYTAKHIRLAQTVTVQLQFERAKKCDRCDISGGRCQRAHEPDAIENGDGPSQPSGRP